MPNVTTSIIINEEGEVLLLKRSDKVKTYKGFWCGISGYIEKNELPIETSYKEIFEETGLSENDIVLIKSLDPICFYDVYKGNKYYWKVFPFLFKIRKKSKVQIDWEHTDYGWFKPAEVEKLNTVPRLKDLIQKI